MVKYLFNRVSDTSAADDGVPWISRRQQRSMLRNILLGTVSTALFVGLPTAPLLAGTQTTAGLFGLPLPNLPIPGGASAGDLFKGAAANQAIKALGSTFTNEAPIVSSADAIFPTVKMLPGGAFQPQAMPASLVSKIQNSDGSVVLNPGDYMIPVNVFCMKASAHSPDGHRYLLAPLKGKWANIIIALNARSAGTAIPHTQLQVLSWNLQAGMKYEELTPESRAIVDRLLPDYKSQLSRSFYEQIEATWSQFSGTIPGLPSMDSALSKLGNTGKAIITLRQTRETLMRYGNNFEALSRTLVLTGQGETSKSAADSTPWSKVSPQVYARLVTQGNYATPGELQLRVSDSNPISLKGVGVATADKSGLVKLAVQPVKVPITGLVGDPQDQSVQPLSMSPQPNNNPKEEEESGTGSLQIEEKGFSGPQPRDPLNQV